MIKKLFLLPLLIMTLFFNVAAFASISTQSQHYLDRQDFSSAKSSIEADLLSDPYDAKTWYFYSRVLMNLEMPNAAKTALNNAMNIDKNFKFAKKGLSQVKSFAGEIEEMIEDHSYNGTHEPYLNVRNISSSDYKNYLDATFGKGHNFGNLNNPTPSDFKRVANNKQQSTPNFVEQDLVSQPVRNIEKPVVVKPKLTPEQIQKEKEAQEAFNKKVIDVFSGILIILFIGLSGFFISNRIKNKKLIEKNNAYQIEQNRVLFDKLNDFSKQLEEDIKDINAFSPNGELLKEYKNMYDLILNLTAQVDINQPVNNRDKIESNYDKVLKLYKKLSHYKKISDFDLNVYRKEETERLEKERIENERLAKIRKEEEAKRKIIEDQKREERRLREIKEKAERKEREIKEQEYYRNNRNNNNQSNSGDIGLALGIISEVMKQGNSNSKKNRNWDSDDNNSDIWNSKKSNHSNDDSNDSIWSTKKSHSNDSSNSSIWNSRSSGGSSSSSKGSKNSDDW